MDILTRQESAPARRVRSIAAPAAPTPESAAQTPATPRVGGAPTALSALPMLFVPTVDVGIPTDRFEAVAAPQDLGRQHQSNWCWAACIQMLLGSQGVAVSQEQVVARAFGGLIDQPASGPQIVAALTGWAPDAVGRAAVVTAGLLPLDDITLLSQLSQQRPAIVGLSAAVPGAPGHANLLTGARYALDACGQPHILSVVLRDPWPETPSRQEISFAEFQSRCMFAVGATVTHL